MKKVILDLCGGTGAWSNPYKESGYIVHIITLPQYDLLKTGFTDDCFHFTGGTSETLVVEKSNVYGILAAPTCTMFSMARTVAKTPRDLKGAMELVDMCLKGELYT